MRDMDGIFIATGPAFQQGTEIERFQNVHIYPMLAKVLGIDVLTDIDGQLKVLSPILRQN